MYKKTANGQILIDMPEALVKGRPMKEEIAYVYMTVAKSSVLVIRDFLEAFKICFQKYPVEFKEFAPTVLAFVKINERKIKLKLNYIENEDECIIQLKNQFKEQND